MLFDNLAVIIPWNPDTTDEYRKRSLQVICDHMEASMLGAEIVIGEGVEQPFNRSRARNKAVEATKREALLILDADTFIPSSSILAGVEALDAGSSWVIPYNTYYNLNQRKTDEIYASESTETLDVEPVRGEYEHRILSWAGALMVKTSDYWKVGGYDERFYGWGWEDVAFRVIADHELGAHERVGSFVSHLWHPRPQEICFGFEDERRNAKLFDKEYRIKYNWKDERG